MIFKKQTKCFLCGKKVGDDGAVLKYKHLDANADAVISDLNLCKKCGDNLQAMEELFNDGPSEEDE